MWQRLFTGPERKILAAAHDLFIASVSLPLALVLRVGADSVYEYYHVLIYAVPVFCVISFCAFLHFGLYNGLWRYTSLIDLFAIIKGTVVSVLLFVVFLFLYARLDDLPRSVPIIQILCLVVLLGSSRLFRRTLFHSQNDDVAGRSNSIPIVLVGAGENAALLIRCVTSSRSSAPYNIVGIIDFTDEHVARNVLSVPIVGSTSRFKEVLGQLTAQGKRPHRIVITTSLTNTQMIELQNQADQENIPLARLPDLTRFRTASLEGRVDLNPIAVEDLLRRPQVVLSQCAIDGLIEGRRILITGAGGSIGGELSRQIAVRQPSQLVLVDFSEFNLYSVDAAMESLCPSVRRATVLLDIRDERRVRALFQQHHPHLVFHAAALKHVPLVENNPLEGFRTNVLGTRNVVEAALGCDALAFLQVSTDKAVKPTSVMGATKRLAELYCQALDLAASQQTKQTSRDFSAGTRFITVRFGNVAGSSGSVIPLFEQQLRQGGPLTVTHPDMRRYFMTIREAVELVLRSAAYSISHNAGRGQIFILDMGEAVRIVDIAEQMIRLAGLKPYKDVFIKFVGLRPGEKLYEELFDPGEESLSGALDGVMLARSKPTDLRFLSRALDAAAEECAVGNDRAALLILRNCVPGFRREESFFPASSRSPAGDDLTLLRGDKRVSPLGVA